MNTVNKFLNEILKIDSKFFVDIGCSDSTEHSQSEVLLNHGWSGLMFEATFEKFKNQISKMAKQNVRVVQKKVNPDNVLKLFEWYKVPSNFYLTIDIDSYDYFVLEKIVEKYRPKLIISEINEKIPAGIKFSLKYNPKFWWDTSHFYGYSISMLEGFLKEHNYKILDLDYNNVVLVEGEQKESLDNIYKSGYLDKKDRKQLYPWNEDFEPIYSMDKDEQLLFIKDKFKKFEGKYILE